MLITPTSTYLFLGGEDDFHLDVLFLVRRVNKETTVLTKVLPTPPVPRPRRPEITSLFPLARNLSTAANTTPYFIFLPLSDC